MAVTTNAAATPSPINVSGNGGCGLWITEAAINNYCERGKPPSEADTSEKISAHLNALVTKALGIPDKVEDIIDGEEEARLVRISDDPDIFALVKKSTNSSAPFAVVTVMTSAFADKKRANGQWSKPNFSVGGLSLANKQALMTVKPIIPSKATVARPIENTSSTPPPIKRGMFLIMYKTKGDPTTHQVWADPAEVEGQLNSLNAVPGSVEVYKRMELGLRILDN